MSKIVRGSDVFAKTAYNGSQVGLNLSSKLKIISITKKPSSHFWKTLKPGDEIELVFNLRNGNSSSALIQICKENVVVLECKATYVAKNLSNFEFKIL